MKKSKVLVVLLVPVLMFTLCVGVVQAGAPRWDSIQSDYAVTTNRFGEDILVHVDEVVAMAGTTDPLVTSVTFRFFPPGEEEEPAWTEPVSDPNYVWDSWKSIPFRRYDSSAYTFDMVGDWGIQVFFNGTGGHLRHTTDIIRIRATTAMVVPEVPIGTLTILLTMLASLAIFARKRF